MLISFSSKSKVDRLKKGVGNQAKNSFCTSLETWETLMGKITHMAMACFLSQTTQENMIQNAYFGKK